MEAFVDAEKSRWAKAEIGQKAEVAAILARAEAAAQNQARELDDAVRAHVATRKELTLMGRPPAPSPSLLFFPIYVCYLSVFVRTNVPIHSRLRTGARSARGCT